MFELHTCLENDIMKIYPQGTLDLTSVDILETKISEIDFKSVHKIHIDFIEVDFIDSTGIGSLVNVTRSFDEQGLDYTLINVSEEIQNIFSIIGLEDLIKIR